MVYVDGGRARPRATSRRRRGDRERFCIDRRRGARAGRLGMHDRGPLRPQRRWTWSGPRTASTASCTSSRRGPRRSPRSAGRPSLESYRLDGQRRGRWSTGRAVGEKIATGTARVIRTSPHLLGRSSPARCWSPTPPTPDWEPVMKTRGGDRHQPRRPHLPRGDRRRELGMPAVVGTGDAHRRAAPTARRSRSPAPRATPAASTTASVAVRRRAHRRRRHRAAAAPRS